MKKFKVALSGIYQAFKTETSLKVHFGSALTVCAGGFFFKLSNTDWCIIVIAILLVIAAELFNTAIEKLCDIIEPDHNYKIGLIKDISAGAVLVITIGAIVVGIIIFTPYITNAF